MSVVPSKACKSRRWSAPLALVVTAWLTPACLVDLDDRCGKNQTYDADADLCHCDAAFARQGNECVPCGDNEVGSGAGCVCAPGFTRASANAPCLEAASLGQACTADEECGADFSHCALEGEEGYCTRADCETAADCPEDYGCNTRARPSFCERPPEGLGTACSDSADCADFPAAYCETVIAGACLVNDCAPDPDKCHGDWVCCDIALLSQSLCIPPSELEGGNCPAGGSLVPRSE